MDRIRWRAASAAAVMMVAQVIVLVPEAAGAAVAGIATWRVKAVDVPTSDVVFDVSRNVLVASIPGEHPSLGNELAEFDPETGFLGRHVFVGSEPGPIALTDDGATAYVGLLGANRIARVDLATFTVVSTFSTGGDSSFGPRYVEEIEALPGRSDVVVASLMKPGFSPRHEGVWVFEDGVALPAHTPGHTGANRIEVGGPGLVYGYNNETTEFGLRRIAVTSAGATVIDTGPSAITGFYVDIELSEGLVYSTSGLVVDPTTRAAVGSFEADGQIEVTPHDDRATFVAGPDVSVFDTTTGALVESRSFPELPGWADTLTATATGFALASWEGLFLLGPDIGGGPVSLPAPPASALDHLGVVHVPIAAADAVADDLRDLVYLSVPSSAPDLAGHVVALDAATGGVVDTLFLGSNPGPLAITADRARLHVGLATTGRVAQVDLATFTPAGSFSLGNSSFGGPLVAEDIDIRPGTSNTLAVSLRNTCCSPRHEGVAVFESGVRLSNSTATHTGANRIAFADSATLYGTNNETSGFEFYRMAVNATGVTRMATTGYLIPGFGVDIELHAGFVFSTNGLVVDPGRAEMVGRFYEWGAVEALPAVGRAVFATDGELAEYDLQHFRPVSRRAVDFGEYPNALVATANGLVAATRSGVVVLTDDVPPPPAVTSLIPSTGSTGGGTTVTIRGSGLSGTTAVHFGATPAAQFIALNDGEISAVSPAHPAGQVTITVTTPAGSADGAAARYTFVVPTTTTTPTTITTTRPPTATTTVPPATAPSPRARSGYWMVRTDGVVHGFGDAQALGDASGASKAVDLEPTPSGNGYWIVDEVGHVFGFGDAAYHGGASRLAGGETVTSISTTPTGRGYWLFTSAGRVIPFGEAPFLGDMSGRPLNGPVLDSVPTPTGRGYYMVASDGGIFTFGDARFQGSMGGTRLNAPVQSLVPDPDGSGYWLVASDGGIFAFDAAFYGSMGSAHLNRPVTGMVGFRRGYLMVAEDGGIFAFGEASFHGSLGDQPPSQPVTSVAAIM